MSSRLHPQVQDTTRHFTPGGGYVSSHNTGLAEHLGRYAGDGDWTIRLVVVANKVILLALGRPRRLVGFCCCTLQRLVYSFCAIFPELEILFPFVGDQSSRADAQRTLFQQLGKVFALCRPFSEDVFERLLRVQEDVQMVGYDMPTFARRTCDKDGSMVIAVLGDAVGGAIQTRLAGKAQLVRRLVASIRRPRTRSCTPSLRYGERRVISCTMWCKYPSQLLRM